MDKNLATMEGEVSEEIPTGWEILKGLFLGDTRNGLNNLSRLSMPWDIYHRWTRGTYFAFNLYRHIVQLLARLPGEVDPKYLLRKEGANQGEPLSMVLYGMRLSVLAEKIWGEYTVFIQSWHANESSMAGAGARLKPAIDRIDALGITHGFLLRLEK